MLRMTKDHGRLGWLGIAALLIGSAMATADPMVANESEKQATDPPPQITITLPGGVEMVLLRVPAGTFTLGSVAEQGRHENEGPAHQVTLSRDFYIGKYEVTQEQWEALMGPGEFTSLWGLGDDYPAYNVSWNDIAQWEGYLTKLNRHLRDTGQPGVGMFRLPTEAEWEYAARAETTTRFSFGDNLACDDHCGPCSLADQYMWWCGNTDPIGARPIGMKLQNPWGLYDMHGNVGEWVADRYHFYTAQSQTDPTDPTGPTIGENRVVRGGSWEDSARDARSAFRYSAHPSARSYYVGFRLVNVCSTHRDLPVGYTAAEPIAITISVTPVISSVNPSTWVRTYAVEEDYPSGWTASGISDGGNHTGWNRKIRWGPFYDNDARTLTYTLTPTDELSGTYAFDGIISVDGTSEPVCGDHLLEAWSLHHPADVDTDWRLSIDELTAYGAAWQEGAIWEVPPNPIPIDYVTNAGRLWRLGEHYHYDAAIDPPWAEGTAKAAAGGLRRSNHRKSGSVVSSFIPTNYADGQGVTVTIAVSPDPSVQAFAVDDTPPAGWVVSDVSPGGSWDANNGQVKWGPFFDNQSRELTYVATPPAGETGVRFFDGRASFDGRSDAITGARSIARGATATCTDTATAMCLNNERFRVEVEWEDFQDNTGSGMVVEFGSNDSGLFWFFDADNWEMLVKVLNGCAITNHYWVFSAATTNVEYTLRVTDTQTGVSKSYFNPLGTSAAAITDTGALATCP